jgi:hypothetical protein
MPAIKAADSGGASTDLARSHFVPWRFRPLTCPLPEHPAGTRGHRSTITCRTARVMGEGLRTATSRRCAVLCQQVPTTYRGLVALFRSGFESSFDGSQKRIVVVTRLPPGQMVR